MVVCRNSETASFGVPVEPKLTTVDASFVSAMLCFASLFFHCDLSFKNLFYLHSEPFRFVSVPLYFGSKFETKIVIVS
jgi:hypothetical protein